MPLSTRQPSRLRSVQSLAGSVGNSDGAFVPPAIPFAGLDMTQLPAGRVYQRSTTTSGGAGKGSGSIPVPITLQADATIIEYRLRDALAQDTPTVQDWTTVAANVPAATTGVLCSGVPADARQYLLDLRANRDNGQIVAGTSPVMMGRLVAIAGQSLAVRMFGRMDGQSATMAGLGITPGPFGFVNAAYDDSQKSATSGVWRQPADGGPYDSAFAGEYLNRSVAASGVACGLVGYAKGAQNLASFAPGGANSAALLAALDVAGGAFEHCIFMQGHSDALAGVAGATYRGLLGQVFASIAGKSTLPFSRAVATIPNISSGSWGTPAQIGVVRSAAAAWCAANGAVYVQPSDLDLIDGVHESMAGAVTLARHFYRAARPDFGLAGTDAGPVITAAARADGSKAVALTVSMPAGATALVGVGSPASRFSVYTRGNQTTKLALDSANPITLAPGSITLNLAADPGNGIGLDVYYGRPLDPSSAGAADGVFDNALDGDGIARGRHLATTLAPVQSPGNALTTGPALSMTGATYGTGADGYGQERTAGYGVTAGAATPLRGTAQSYTIECTMMMPANPGNIVVLFGQTFGTWVGVNSAGRLVANHQLAGGGETFVGTSTNSNAGTNAVVAGNGRHHIELDLSPAGAFLFCDGVLVAASNRAPVSNGDLTTPFGVACLGDSGINTAYVPNGSIDEVAVWNVTRHTANFAPPTAPYTGGETGLKALWHLDGDGSSGITA